MIPRLRQPSASWTFFVIALGLGTNGAIAAPRLHLAAELGPELDTNALRAAEDGGQQASSRQQVVTSPVLRATAAGGVALRAGRYGLDLHYEAGGRLFLRESAHIANELVQDVKLRNQLWLHWARLYLQATYYDSFQNEAPVQLEFTERDFRMGTIQAGLEPGAGHWAAVPFVNLGYLGLQFKPDQAFSHHALLLRSGINWRLSSGSSLNPVDWMLSASYGLALRVYNGLAEVCVDNCSGAAAPPVLATGDEHLRHHNHLLRVKLQHSGAAEVELWYTLEPNVANSYGQSYLRHSLGLRFTTPLVWKVLLDAQAVVRLIGFSDPLARNVDVAADLDNENRSRLGVYLAREISRRWSLGLRYSAYVNEATSAGVGSRDPAPRYLRQTLALGLRFEYDSTDTK